MRTLNNIGDKIKVRKLKQLVLLMILFLPRIPLFGQGIKTVSFDGYQQWIYQRPMMNNGKWDAYYQSNDQKYSAGEISIKDKIFSIIFSNGENWTAKITKKEVIGSYMDEKGIVQTIYRGIWTDNQKEAKLVITESKNSSCIFKLYSRQIKDTGVIIDGKEIKFDDWECYRIITQFATAGKCLQ